MTTAISSSTSINGVPVVAQNSGTQMGQSDFLRLMTAQLTQQDPFNPVDNQQMVAQMAQFSSLAGVTETNATLQQISEQLNTQTALLQDIKAATPVTTTETATTTADDTTSQEG